MNLRKPSAASNSPKPPRSKIAVNQQMRWDAGIRCARILIDDGWLGTPTYGTIQVHCNTDWSLWPWIYQGKRVEVMFHSIHYIDSLRFLLGDPASVFTSGSRGPAETTKPKPKRSPSGITSPACKY